MTVATSLVSFVACASNDKALGTSLLASSCLAPHSAHQRFQAAMIHVRPGGSNSVAPGVFFRRALDTAGRFDTFEQCCHCGHDLGRECPLPFQECHRCPHAPGARSSLKTRSASITALPDASGGPSSVASISTPGGTIVTASRSQPDPGRTRHDAGGIGIHLGPRPDPEHARDLEQIDIP
jgi:hypothetical protein